MVAVIVALGGIFSLLFLGISHAGGQGSPIKSGWSGYCLDDYRSKKVEGNQVDLWPCNDSAAQDWQINLTQIIHNNDMCLTASSDTDITIDSCNDNNNQYCSSYSYGGQVITNCYDNPYCSSDFYTSLKGAWGFEIAAFIIVNTCGWIALWLMFSQAK